MLPEAARTGSLGLKMDSYLVDPEDPDKWKRVVVEQGSTNFIANQTYEYAAWVKTDGPVGMVGLTLAVYFPDGAPRVQHNKWFADGTFDTKGEWQQISLQAHVPENASSLISYLRFEGPGFAYFDDVSLRVVE